jgi:hypothetical protein
VSVGGGAGEGGAGRGSGRGAWQDNGDKKIINPFPNVPSFLPLHHTSTSTWSLNLIKAMGTVGFMDDKDKIYLVLLLKVGQVRLYILWSKL